MSTIKTADKLARHEAVSFLKRKPEAASLIVDAAAQLAKDKDPAALVYSGASDLAKASKEGGLPFGLETGDLMKALTDIIIGVVSD